MRYRGIDRNYESDDERRNYESIFNRSTVSREYTEDGMIQEGIDTNGDGQADMYRLRSDWRREDNHEGDNSNPWMSWGGDVWGGGTDGTWVGRD